MTEWRKANMTDAHVHLERGAYTKEWVREFVGVALSRGIDDLCLLEHSHRFVEFADYYRNVAAHDEYQRAWLARKMKLSLRDYLSLVEECRAERYPIRLRFGLEVCYFPGCDRELEGLVADLGLDFLTGAVHWIDGWGFDHSPESWKSRDVDDVYRRYFETMLRLVDSGRFTRLAHPDSIKCFGARPSYSLDGTYAILAEGLASRGMEAEESGGLHINYGCSEIGVDEGMIVAFAARGVRMVPASDAHRPEDVGLTVAASEVRIAKARESALGGTRAS